MLGSHVCHVHEVKAPATAPSLRTEVGGEQRGYRVHSKPAAFAVGSLVDGLHRCLFAVDELVARLAHGVPVVPDLKVIRAAIGDVLLAAVAGKDATGVALAP